MANPRRVKASSCGSYPTKRRERGEASINAAENMATANKRAEQTFSDRGAVLFVPGSIVIARYRGCAHRIAQKDGLKNQIDVHQNAVGRCHTVFSGVAEELGIVEHGSHQRRGEIAHQFGGTIETDPQHRAMVRFGPGQPQTAVLGRRSRSKGSLRLRIDSEQWRQPRLAGPTRSTATNRASNTMLVRPAATVTYRPSFGFSAVAKRH